MEKIMKDIKEKIAEIKDTETAKQVIDAVEKVGVKIAENEKVVQAVNYSKETLLSLALKFLK